MTLEDLPAAYATARETQISSASLTPLPADTCKYCRKSRFAWAGGALDGHARCVVTREFIAELNQLWRSDPKLSRRRIAALIGVSVSTVNAWTSYGRQR